MSILLFYLFL